MFSVDEETFRKIVAEGIDNIPSHYAKYIKNLAFVVEDEPTEAQRRNNNLQPWQTLLGLYEGIPLTRRNSNYNLVLPDKITIFKGPSERNASSLADLKSIVNKTIWHEVAHFYGLGHGRIHELEQPK
jgi:predicted Zn-dependent protease with MMP-like domain